MALSGTAHTEKATLHNHMFSSFSQFLTAGDQVITFDQLVAQSDGARSLRRLTPSYAGPLLQVRQSVTNALFDIGPAAAVQTRTNRLKNPTGAGIVGTALPTGWVAQPGTTGLSITAVGAGTEYGQQYVDVRFSGTATASALCALYIGGTPTASVFDTLGMTAAAPSQTWTGSLGARALEGSLGGIASASVRLRAQSGATEVGSARTISNPSLGLFPARIGAVILSTPANTDRLFLSFDFFTTSGVVYNATIRIYLPNIEQGKGNALPSSNVDAPIVIANIGDLDVSAALNLIVDNATTLACSRWNDQSGKGRNLINPTTTQQPILINLGCIQTLNGRPALLSNGTTSQLYVDGATWTLSGLTEIYTNAVVLQTGTNSAPWASFVMGTGQIGGTGSALSYVHALSASGTIGAANVATSISSTGAASNAAISARPIISGGRVAASNAANAYTNGVESVSSGAGFFAGPLNANFFRVMGSAQNVRGLVGLMSEAFVFSSGLSTTSRAVLESNQSAYYGIPLS
jgi:hypothetical protein